jgi:nitrite reductase/ring-hydroxylating ferredoxin subunit
MGKLSELPPGKVLEKSILARRVAVFNVNGRLYGIESDCKHMRASLANGEVKDGLIKCRWHGWRYNLETGECLNLKKTRLKIYPVTIEGDDIFVEI